MNKKRLKKMKFLDKVDVIGQIVDDQELIINYNNEFIIANHIKIKNQKIIIGNHE